jgi:protein-tyrosine kinase
VGLEKKVRLASSDPVQDDGDDSIKTDEILSTQAFSGAGMPSGASDQLSGGRVASSSADSVSGDGFSKGLTVASFWSDFKKLFALRRKPADDAEKPEAFPENEQKILSEPKAGRSAHEAFAAKNAMLLQNACDPDFRSAQWFSSGSIGGILLDAGKISAEHAEQILRLQKSEGLRFGEAAIKLGFATESDIQFALSRQFDYPYLPPDEQQISRELVAAYQPFSPQVESLRAMRTQLMLRWFDSGLTNSLAIVSAAPGDGRSYLAANLAVVFSQLGEKTLLIDGDLRNPRQHELFGLDNQSGFSTYLSGRIERPPIHRISAFVDLSVLLAGPIPPNPQELLYRSQFVQLLAQVTREYNVVIIDTPPADYHADAQLIAAKTGTTLVVTRRNRSKVRDVAALSDSIRSIGGNIVGGIVNDY